MRRLLPAWQQVFSTGRRMGGGVLDLLVPQTCHACQVPVTAPGGLCAVCWGKLELVSAPVCDVYGTPMAYDGGTGAISPRAIEQPPGWHRARGAVVFNDASQALVHALKYRDRHEVTTTLARMMLHAGREIVVDADLLVPVPLHQWRLWQRRYNQSALLARELSGLSGVEMVPDLLLRTRQTRSQVGLKQGERARNVKGAFEVSARHLERVAGARIVLVDDVMTSGSTASECARALLAAGAVQVDLLVFALVSGRA
jgi:ComF family protein